MARSVPADLEDALATNPAARERFWAMPPGQKDAWVAYVERSRFPGARRRRVAETVRRLGGRRAAAATTVDQELPGGDNRALWLLVLAVLAGVAALAVWWFAYRDNGSKPSAVVVSSSATVPKVTGIRYQAAQFQLKEAKLGSTVTRRRGSKPKGIVLKQTPKDGVSVAQGTKVVLVVSNGPPGVAMPDVVGLAAADAIRALRTRKLQPTLKQAASTQAPGTVLSQQPKAGKRAKPGTPVVLTVAKGAAPVAVPDVTGQTRSQASSALQAAGLTPHVVQVPSSTAQPGTVVAQRPAAGQKAAKGSTVRLNVAKAAQTATVTSTTTTTTSSSAAAGPYAGMRVGAAAQQIAAGRRQVTVVYVASSKPAGVVVASSTSTPRIRLQVSAGPSPAPLTDVPDVTGEDAATAEQDLQAAGFDVVQVTWPVSDPTNDGIVTFQTPAGGGRIPDGSTVLVYVGSASGG